MRTFILLTYFLIGSSIYGLSAQEADSSVERVLVVFKTHLDIGYTDLSSRVERHYIDTFIPKALAVAEELRAAGGEERYVWTTGSWLIWAYLHQASPEQVRGTSFGTACLIQLNPKSSTARCSRVYWTCRNGWTAATANKPGEPR